MLDNLTAQQLPLWDRLTSSEADMVRNAGYVRSFARGEVLRSPCEECLGMLYLLSGSLRVYIVSDEGREITLFSLGVGETCVISASCVLSQITFQTVITATADCQVVVIPSPIFKELIDGNINVRCMAYEILARRASSIVWVFQQILFLHLDQRIAAYLVNQVERTGSITIEGTQEHIAQEVNSAREAVTRQLTRFADEGLVEVQRGRVIILNLPALKNLSRYLSL